MENRFFKGWFIGTVISILIWTLIFIGVSAMVSATDYYYNQSGGNDANDCSTPALACKTIVDLNGKALSAGDNIYFARGEMWRLPTDAYIDFISGNSTANMTYSNYGTGNKPLFIGSMNASHADNWTNHAENIWKTTFTSTVEMGTMIMDAETVGGHITSAYANLDTQDEYFYNSTDDKLYVYSVGNPASVHTNIEIGIETDVMNYDTKNYVNIVGFDIRYGARHGIDGRDVNHIYIANNSLSWIGGAYQSGTTRYGEAIETWNSAANVIIEYNDMHDIFEGGISPQAYGDDSVIENVTIRYNTYNRGEMCIAVFNRGANSHTHNLLIDHNTCYNMTPTILDNALTYGYGLYMGDVDNPINMTFTNNIIQYVDTKVFTTANHVAGVNLVFDYNLYKDPVGNLLTYDGTSYTEATFATYQAAKSQDANSEVGDALLDTSTLIPAWNSLACTMSSTGNYVGALPCADAPEEPATTYSFPIKIGNTILRIMNGVLRI